MILIADGGSTKADWIALDNDKKNTYKIVGRDEADVKNGLIYYKSPLGRGFIGKNKEDFVVIETPSGEKNFEILDVKYI